MINLKKLLTENRITDFETKYPKVSQVAKDYAIQNDPSGNQKYLDWIGNRLSNEPGYISISEMMSLLKVFNDKFKNADIYAIKSYNDLKNLVAQRPISKKEKKRTDIDVIVDNEEWYIIAPLTQEACGYYGHNTRWCIAGSDEWWNKYFYRDESTIIIIKNKTTGERVALTIDPYGSDWTFYDEKDHTISYRDALPEEIQEEIQDYADNNSGEGRRQDYEEMVIEEYLKDEGILSILKEYLDDLHFENKIIEPINIKLFIKLVQKKTKNLKNILISYLYYNLQNGDGDKITSMGEGELLNSISDNQGKESEEYQAIEQSTIEYLNYFTEMDKYIKIIVDVIGEDYYNLIDKNFDVETILKNAIKNANIKLNDPRQSTIYPTIESVKINNIRDIIKVLKNSGEDKLIYYILKASKQNIKESKNINFKSLVEGIRLDWLNSKISELENEWDRIDSMGGQEHRQQEISKELQKLKREKSNWDKVYQAIGEVEAPPQQPPAIIQKQPHSINKPFQWDEQKLKDAYIVISTLYGEARGEGPKGMHAVLNVIMNRANGDISKAAKICLAKKQFSMWNGISNKYKFSDRLKQKMVNDTNTPSGKMYFKARELVGMAANNSLSDITGGANHYLNSSKLKKLPSWADESKKTTKIGNHTFYKL